jgi:hypothetical protein
MQTGIGMSYSDSSYFSDKFSYKTLFYFELWFGRYEFSKVQSFSAIFRKTGDGLELFSPTRVYLERLICRTGVLTGTKAVVWHGRRLTGAARLSVRIKVPKKKFQVCIPRDSNSDLQR